MRRGNGVVPNGEHVLLGRYLLGLLPEGEMEEVEARFFTTDEKLLVVDEAERKLIAAYVGGTLSEEESEAYEEHFLRSGENRENTELARALATVRPARASMWVRLAAILTSPRLAPVMCAAAVVLLVVSAGLWVSQRNSARSVRELQGQLEAANRQSAEWKRHVQERAPRSLAGGDVEKWGLATVAMGQDKTPSGPEPLVEFTAEKRIQVRLIELPFGTGQQTVDAVLRAGSVEIRRQAGLKPAMIGGLPYVAITLAADDLAAYMGKRMELELAGRRIMFRPVEK